MTSDDRERGRELHRANLRGLYRGEAGDAAGTEHDDGLQAAHDRGHRLGARDARHGPSLLPLLTSTRLYAYRIIPQAEDRPVAENETASAVGALVVATELQHELGRAMHVELRPAGATGRWHHVAIVMPDGVRALTNDLDLADSLR